jgi:preprotein translocase subunit Sec63
VDANKTFERFFNENDIRDEDEEKFFSKNYPNPMNNYYAILGVKKEDSLDDIKAVYRKLALKYHPKNNPNDEEAHKKFIEVNQAFNAISN